MPVISVRIPQLGEGLQEALLIEFLKEPGDKISRDEPIYVMETDKATTEVESPYSGTLVEWTVEPGTVLNIGTEIARMEVAGDVQEMPAGSSPTSVESRRQAQPTSRSNRNRSGTFIPPRTRKYLKDKGLLELADQIPAEGSKLMPDDVDRFLAGNSSSNDLSNNAFKLVELPKSQIVLNYRLSRSHQVCVPATLANEIGWATLESARSDAPTDTRVSAFAMACWCVVQSMQRHDKFRSILSADGKALKVFDHVNLGIAVALPGDEMVTAVVQQADVMEQAAFFKAFNDQVEKARDGVDQADESTTITVSNIGKAGMRMGIPAIVVPAVATLAIGEVYDQPIPKGESFEFRRCVTATLCFDHRIANGVVAELPEGIAAPGFAAGVATGIDHFSRVAGCSEEVRQARCRLRRATLQLNAAGLVCHRAASVIRVMSCSMVCPSARAEKLSAMRWRRTGPASAIRSSVSGAGMPRSRARARRAREKAWLARGPGPQRRCSAN